MHQIRDVDCVWFIVGNPDSVRWKITFFFLNLYSNHNLRLKIMLKYNLM